MLLTFPPSVETEAEETRWINALMVVPFDSGWDGNLGSAGMMSLTSNDIAAK